MGAWVDVGVPLFTAAVGWVGGTITFWRARAEEKADRQHAQAELRLARDELAQARRDASDARERWQEEADRIQLDRAAELCRGDEKQADQGRAILVGMAAMGSTNPRVTELLDQMTQLELGRTVDEIATARAAGEDPEVVEVVVLSDVLSTSDGARVENAGDSTDDGIEEVDDRDEVPQDDQGDPPTGGGRPDGTAD